MLATLGDLVEGHCSFSFDNKGCLHLVFPDQSEILDSDDGIQVFGAKSLCQTSDAETWLKKHCPGLSGL